MKESFSTAFEGSSSRMGKLKSKSLRMFRATKLKNELAAVETKIDSASNRILLLALWLADDHRGSTKDVFRPTTNTPALTDAISLDFGNRNTPEGILKRAVLSGKSSITVAYGVVGMAGVGKTVALQGLASDRQIRDRFPDGILFMTLGQGATVQTVIWELKEILILTGASNIAADVRIVLLSEML